MQRFVKMLRLIIIQPVLLENLDNGRTFTFENEDNSNKFINGLLQRNLVNIQIGCHFDGKPFLLQERLGFEWVAKIKASTG